MILQSIWRPASALNDGQRRPFANAGNTQHQIKPPGEIVVGTKALGNGAYLRGPACLQPLDVAVNNAPQARLVDMLEPGFEARDVFINLFKEGQMSGQFRQSGIWRDPRLIERCCARCNQNRVERVVLGVNAPGQTP